MLEFKKNSVSIKFKIPSKLKKLKDNLKDNYNSEIRFHPLLKWYWSAISVARSSYQPYKVDEDKIKQLFIPRVHYFKNPEELTPEFPELGRLQKNEAIIFPNLFSWADIAVCRITEEESLYLKDISVQQLSDALDLCQDYFIKKAELDKKGGFYPTINMNFLKPAASSILHPHFQLVCTPEPNPMLYHILHTSEEYFEVNKSNFFMDLVEEEEKRGKRWIGKQGNCNFMTSFCPITGSDEVMFISDLESSFPIKDLKNVVDIATGINKIFKSYHEMKIFSVNMTIFSQKFDEKSDFFNLCGFIWSRPLRNLDVSDRGFAEIGYKIALSFDTPESVAKKIRENWK